MLKFFSSLFKKNESEVTGVLTNEEQTKMFCFQCQEAAGNTGCASNVGVCGKTADVANLQDLLVYTLKGIAVYALASDKKRSKEISGFVAASLFKTITNANFDRELFIKTITLLF